MPPSHGVSCQKHRLGFHPLPKGWHDVAAVNQIHVVLQQAFDLLLELDVLKEACARGQIHQQIDIARFECLITGHGSKHNQVGRPVSRSYSLQAGGQGLEFLESHRPNKALAQSMDIAKLTKDD